MDEHSPSHLQIIGQLAREYDQKYQELERLVSEIPREKVPSQLRALAERTTDRFRSAQIALLSMHGLFEGEEGEAATAITKALCGTFDEMRIVFQFLLRHISEETTGKNI
ncbi:MAG: hypothetical protein WAW37_08535 [Syntrophobacteraceae bacterium]